MCVCVSSYLGFSLTSCHSTDAPYSLIIWRVNRRAVEPHFHSDLLEPRHENSVNGQWLPAFCLHSSALEIIFQTLLMGMEGTQII